MNLLSYSASALAQVYKQPYGGFLPVKSLTKTVLDSPVALHPRANETISAYTMETVVKQLSRFLIGVTAEKAFGFHVYKDKNEILAIVTNMAQNIKGLDDDSIRTALRLVCYDAWSLNYSQNIINGKPTPEPSVETIENIRTMVSRSLDFFKTYGPVTKDGFDFAPNGYTDIVEFGDGDFLTEDTLWDFTTSHKTPTSRDTLRLLMYYIMGKHSDNPIFDSIYRIGIYNPRSNSVYLFGMYNMPFGTIREVEQDVIGFSDSVF